MVRRMVVGAGAAVVLAIGLGALAWAQTPPAPTTEQQLEELRRQMQALMAAQVAIQKQLDEIRALLKAQQPQARPAPPPAATDIEAVVETAGAPAKGSASAKLTVIEFSDYECPFCARYTNDTLGTLTREYIDTGKVRYVFRNFPLESIHPRAFRAGVAALCAGAQGRYWEMHDRLFANQRALDAASLVAHGRAIGLDMRAYEQCLAADATAARVRQDQTDGGRAGVGSTPSFLLGLTTPGDSKVQAVRMIRGAHPYTVFKSEIDKLLAGR